MRGRIPYIDDLIPDRSQAAGLSRRERRHARNSRSSRARTPIIVGAVIITVAALITSGFALLSQDKDWVNKNRANAAQVTTTSTSTTTTTVAPTTTTTTTIPVFAQPAVVDLPSVPGGEVSEGSTGPEVAAYQARLTSLRFDPGARSGTFTSDMTYAIHALQKIMGVPVSGRLREPERVALMNFQYPAPLKPGAEANRTEIDIARQVMTLYVNHQVRLITTISTGSGEYYCYTPFYQTVRVCENALTPEGRFTFTYFVNAWHRSPLGQLYRPFYFNRGIAVHGYPDVPVLPESHGCTRIPMRIADYWDTLVKKGDIIYVIGKASTTVAARNVINPKQSALPGTRTVGGVPSAAARPTTTTAAPSLGPVDSTTSTSTPTESTSTSTTTTTTPSEPPPPPL